VIVKLVVVTSLLFELLVEPGQDCLFAVDVLSQQDVCIRLLPNGLGDKQTVMLEVVDFVSLGTQLILDRSLFSLEFVDFQVQLLEPQFLPFNFLVVSFQLIVAVLLLLLQIIGSSLRFEQ
jgi:hypothetical protein